MIKNVLSKLTKSLYALLACLVPVGFKRLVLLSTLYQKGAEQKIIEHIDYDKLNQNMKIASNNDAIESALFLKDVIWKDVDLNKLLQCGGVCELDGERVDACEAKLIANQLLSRIPWWLRYGKTEMEKDLMFMFSFETVRISK